jgi:two-component system phosphate regulon response regulator PhoB
MKYLPKILFVDDEMDYLHLNTALLRKHGFDVYSLASGEEVFTTVSSFKPNLIVLDVMLGNHDGRMICQQLKADPEYRSIKIILGSAFPEVAKDYDQYGAEEFLQKPHTIDQLISRINHHLQR